MPTGPTAWQAPLFPLMLAGLLVVWNGDHATVTVVVVIIQAFTLIATGGFVIAVAKETTDRVGGGLATTVFIVLLLSQFRSHFQNYPQCLDGVVGYRCYGCVALLVSPAG